MFCWSLVPHFCCKSNEIRSELILPQSFRTNLVLTVFNFEKNDVMCLYYCWCFRAPVEVASWIPIIYKVLYMPGGCYRFQPSTAWSSAFCCFEARRFQDRFSTPPATVRLPFSCPFLGVRYYQMSALETWFGCWCSWLLESWLVHPSAQEMRV